jgi:hypothetical protein
VLSEADCGARWEDVSAPEALSKLLGVELRIPLDEETLWPRAQTHIVSSLAANMATAAVQNMRNIGAIVAVAGLFDMVQAVGGRA